MADNEHKEESPPSMQLISYQVGEVKGLVQTVINDQKQYKTDTDKRLIELEKFQAIQILQDNSSTKPDWQKIILAFISIIVSLIALYFYEVHR